MFKIFCVAEEHGFLLFCGLGARKWEVEMNCNSLTFKQAILNIYPRLRSVIGYNLYTVAKDKKTFEKIPEKVNTPKRIRSYLGSHFTGCMIIVPVSDIVLVSPAVRVSLAILTNFDLFLDGGEEGAFTSD